MCHKAFEHGSMAADQCVLSCYFIQGAKSLVDYLTWDSKYNKIVLISLREDPTVLCDGELFSLRHVKRKDRHFFLPCITEKELLQLENDVVAAVKLSHVDKVMGCCFSFIKRTTLVLGYCKYATE